MSDATGVVTVVDGDYAFVRMDEAGCGRCHEPGGCGGVNIGKMLCSTPQEFRVLNPGKSVVGERVSVVVAEGAVRHGAFLAYGLPLLMLLVGALGGSVIAGDSGGILGAVCGLLVAFPFLRSAQRKSATDLRFSPFIKTGNRVG